MKYFTVILLLIAIITGAAYFAGTAEQNTNNTSSAEVASKNTEPTADEKSSDDPFSWAGQYQGKKPCSDCGDIEVTLVIGKKGTYSLTETNTNNPSASVESNGKFSWAATGDAITLLNTEGKPQFLIGNNHVSLVGNKEYLLTKTGK